MLKTYCKKHVIATHVQPRVGAGHRSEEVAFHNKDNWVDCGDLVSFVENYRKITNGYDKTVEIATNPQDTNEKEDTLVVFEFEYQAFVASKPRNQDNVYIADGTNELDKNPKTLEFMKNLVAPRILVTVKLGDQLRLDECASSAAIIALEFLKNINSSGPPAEAYAPISLRSLLREKWRGAASANLKKDALLLDHRKMVIYTCGNTF